MDVKIEGNPGAGNSYYEYHINKVETFAPNATTVINNYYSDRKPAQATLSKAEENAVLIQRQHEILDYVGSLKPFVAFEWKNRYESMWRSILALPEVAAAVYEPGKQKDTTFNRNLVANILYLMTEHGIITERNATALTLALENDKEHSVRAQLRSKPCDREVTEAVIKLLDTEI